MTIAIPQCSTCGFDAAAWTGQDASRTAAAAAVFLEYAVERLPAGLAERSAPPGRSILEAATVLATVLAGVAGESPPTDARRLSGIVETTRSLAAAAYRRLGSHPDPEAVPPAREAAHAVMHAIGEIAAARASLGDEVGPLIGTVHQISASGGGVPKRSVSQGQIDRSGLVGDRQAARAHHGRPWQAVCLYSTEVIDALRSEGHSISPGAAGENLTLSGIAWDQMRSGLFVDVGEVRLQVSVPAVPCSKNARWFVDGDPNRIQHQAYPGASRWYASVVVGGIVRPGDKVTVHS